MFYLYEKKKKTKTTVLVFFLTTPLSLRNHPWC